MPHASPHRFPRVLVALSLSAAAAWSAGCASRHATKDQERIALERRINLAASLVQARNYVEAQRLLEGIVAADPANPDAHYYLGITRFYLGEDAAAEESLRESLRIRPRSGDAHNALGLILNRRGDSEGAMGEYRLALEDPGLLAPEKVLVNIAACLDAQGKTDDAILQLRRAVERNPKYYEGHYELAKLLDRQEQTREAILEYEVAAPEFGSDPGYHYRIGLACFRDRQTDCARDHLGRVVSALPGSEKATKAREILDLLQAAPAPGRPPASAGRP